VLYHTGQRECGLPEHFTGYQAVEPHDHLCGIRYLHHPPTSTAR
jgi:hypothetical protein